MRTLDSEPPLKPWHSVAVFACIGVFIYGDRTQQRVTIEPEGRARVVTWSWFGLQTSTEELRAIGGRWHRQEGQRWTPWDLEEWEMQGHGPHGPSEQQDEDAGNPLPAAWR